MAELYTQDPRLLPPILSGFARRVLEDEPYNNEYLFESLFPNVFNAQLEYELNQGSVRTFTGSIPFRAFDAEPSASGREGYSIKRGKMPPLAEYKVLSEGEAHRLIRGEISQRARDLIYRDVEDLVRRSQNTMEWARAQLLDTGQLDLGGELAGITINFNRKAARNVTLGTLWNNPAAPAINEERAVWKAIRDEEGIGPIAAYATPEVVDALRTNQAYLNATRDIRVPAEISLAQINEIRARHELPPIIEYEQRMLAPGSNVASRVMPANKLFYVTGPAGETQWGRPIDAEKPGVQIDADLGGPVIYTIVTDHTPIQFRTFYSAIGLPLMGYPDRTASIQVLP